jgi:hypothetical protein
MISDVGFTLQPGGRSRPSSFGIDAYYKDRDQPARTEDRQFRRPIFLHPSFNYSQAIVVKGVRAHGERTTTALLVAGAANIAWVAGRRHEQQLGVTKRKKVQTFAPDERAFIQNNWIYPRPHPELDRLGRCAAYTFNQWLGLG